jgi:lipooligosaccharide transport system ATP-binding protein
MDSREVLIEAKALSKKFDSFTAVDQIDFEVYKGECIGFLGPNGAGKTTTVRMMYCFLLPTSGELYVAGKSVKTQCREIKSVVGVAPQEDNLDPDFTVIKNLTVYARYFDIPPDKALKRAKELLKFFQLEEKRDVSIMALSTGMKRRLIFARALINNPQVLLLDEPTTGLDPQARHLVWDEVRQLKKQKVTVILTTHYMDEAQILCDRILIMDHGKIIEQGTPSELIRKHVGQEVFEVDYEEATLALLTKVFPDSRIERVNDRIQVFTDQSHGVFEAFLSEHKLQNVSIRNANIEDVFLKLTGRGLRSE